MGCKIDIIGFHTGILDDRCSLPSFEPAGIVSRYCVPQPLFSLGGTVHGDVADSYRGIGLSDLGGVYSVHANISAPLDQRIHSGPLVPLNGMGT